MPEVPSPEAIWSDSPRDSRTSHRQAMQRVLPLGPLRIRAKSADLSVGSLRGSFADYDSDDI